MRPVIVPVRRARVRQHDLGIVRSELVRLRELAAEVELIEPAEPDQRLRAIGVDPERSREIELGALKIRLRK